MKLRHSAPWLDWDLGAPHQVISWAVHRPGIVRARRILWREVRNADLPADLDAAAWLAGELRAIGAGRAVAMLTSRWLSAHVVTHASVEGVEVDCVATAGLSNAERVGARVDRHAADWGTINIGVRVSEGLTVPALVEAMSIAAEARTVAVLEAGHTLPTGIASGTGTDCIALAAPPGETAYAGLHTALGEAIGAAVLDAVSQAARGWAEDWQTLSRKD